MKTNRTSAEFQPNRVLSYFKAEWRALLIVTVSGLIYNIGLLAGPWFEGTMTGYLVEILNGTGQFSGMLMLVISFAVVTAVVQISRYVKRFYVRRFANNVNRRMKEFLYGSLVKKSRASLREEGEGNIMTKAILDVDDCVEGMRKFTTELFDTGVALVGYVVMLLAYDRSAGTALAAALGIGALFLLPESLQARFLSILDFSNASASGRFVLWSECLAVWKDHWLLGIGLVFNLFTLKSSSYLYIYLLF